MLDVCEYCLLGKDECMCSTADDGGNEVDEVMMAMFAEEDLKITMECCHWVTNCPYGGCDFCISDDDFDF